MALCSKDRERLAQHLAVVMAGNILMDRNSENATLVNIAVAMEVTDELNHALERIAQNATGGEEANE